MNISSYTLVTSNICHLEPIPMPCSNRLSPTPPLEPTQDDPLVALQKASNAIIQLNLFIAALNQLTAHVRRQLLLQWDNPQAQQLGCLYLRHRPEMEALLASLARQINRSLPQLEPTHQEDDPTTDIPSPSLHNSN